MKKKCLLTVIIVLLTTIMTIFVSATNSNTTGLINLVENGNAEDLSNINAFYGSEGNSNVEIITYDNNNVWLVTPAKDGYILPHIKQKFEFVAGATYNVSLKAKIVAEGITGSTSLVCRLTYNSGNYKDHIVTSKSMTINDTEWTSIEFNFSVDKNAEKNDTDCISFYTNPVGSQGVSYMIDDVVVTSALGEICKLKWSITDDTLTIHHSGIIQYSKASDAPWYSQKDNIKNIVIHDSKKIGNNLFDGYSNLENVNLPNSMIEIGEYAFRNCAKLSSITIPNNVVSIGNATFSGCTNLATITIGNSVTNIGNSVFNECTSLKSVIIPNSVTKLGNYVFYNCNRLENVTIGKNVTSIGNYAFNGCSNLSAITIPSSVTWIGNYAFDKCSNLSFVDIVDIASWCNIDFSNIYANPLNTGATLYLNNIEVKNIIIPDGVTEIKPYIFSNYGVLESLVIPDSVRNIGKYAFYYCKSLTSITFGNYVKSIGEYAFYNCINLTSVNLPDSLNSIGKSAFSDCKITSLVIPSNVISIGEQAFYNCQGLTNVEISNSVTDIGEEAFSFCTYLTSINIGNSVTNIGENAFYYCKRLNSVYINDITTWHNIVFGNAEANPLYEAEKLYLNGVLVKQLNIPNGITIISSNNFAGGKCIECLIIPSSVTIISQGAFANCSNITEIYYMGTAEQWKNVRIASNNGTLDTATVYTNYVPNRLKITFHSNTTTDVLNMPVASCAYGEYILPSEKPLRTGYKFIGWSTLSTSTKADYLPGDKMDVYSDITLYAVWEMGDKYSIDVISLLDTGYNKIETIPDTAFFAEVTVTNNISNERATVLITTYDSNGRMLDIDFLYANPDVGKSVTFGTQIENEKGNVAKIKAFVITDLKSFSAVAEAVELVKV